MEGLQHNEVVLSPTTPIKCVPEIRFLDVIHNSKKGVGVYCKQITIPSFDAFDVKDTRDPKTEQIVQWYSNHNTMYVYLYPALTSDWYLSVVVEPGGRVKIGCKQMKDVI